MAKPKRPGGPKQKLSRAAALRKAIRDKAYAMTPARRAKKAEAQRKSCPKGYDYDHKRGKCVPMASNRGNEGKGTKKEGGRNYRVTKAKSRTKRT